MSTDREDKRTNPPAETREILVPHDPKAKPVTAVRNFLIQASLSHLRSNGHYDRYSALIAPDTLAELVSMSITPGWIPIELALAHYEACDNLMLSPEQFTAMGYGVGERVHETVLVAPAKRTRDTEYDVWSSEGALHRMWPRLFQGGSVQTVKIGPKTKLIEERGFRLSKYQYYRQTHVAAVVATHRSLGNPDVLAKVESYSPSRDELVVRVWWT